MNNYEELARKALCYCICMDIARTALSSLGSANTADKTQVVMSCYDEVTSAAKESANGGKQ